MSRQDVFHPDYKAMPYWWEAYRPTAGELTSFTHSLAGSSDSVIPPDDLARFAAALVRVSRLPPSRDPLGG